MVVCQESCALWSGAGWVLWPPHRVAPAAVAPAAVYRHVQTFQLCPCAAAGMHLVLLAQCAYIINWQVHTNAAHALQLPGVQCILGDQVLQPHICAAA